MRIALRILGWFGLVLMTLGTWPSFASSLSVAQTGPIGTGAGYAVTLVAGFLATPMIAAGGLMVRHKPFGIAAITVGMIYIATFFGYAIDFDPRWVVLGGLLFSFLPAFASIATGVIVIKKWPHKRRWIAANGARITPAPGWMSEW